jgi:dipeptidyl aminopeptidase/acylaminoacyl peptidase
MRRVAPVLLPLLAVGAVVTACSGSGENSDGAEPSATGCPRVDLEWPSRALPGFFPPSRAGLWLPYEERCVYVVFPDGEKARPFWGGRPGERVLAVAWAPDGESVAITTESPRRGWRRHSWRVVLLRRDGTVLRRLAATGAAFLRDGRLAVSREGGIDLLVGSRARRLASREELEQVAGFRARRPLVLSHDTSGYAGGHGIDQVALTLWSGGSGAYTGWKSVVLVVSAGGKVTRASPAYRAAGPEGVVSGWAWSPDGRELFVMAEVPGPPARRRRASHDHCLDIWSADRRRRRAFCESELPRAHHSHFEKLTWTADGKRGLLNNGTIVTRDGRVVGHASVCSGQRREDVATCTFEVQWEPGPA